MKWKTNDIEPCWPEDAVTIGVGTMTKRDSLHSIAESLKIIAREMQRPPAKTKRKPAKRRTK